jgi:serine/threonine protein kinase
MEILPRHDPFFLRLHKRMSPLRIFRRWLYQISQALVYIERKHIIHRDIKLANVLVDGGLSRSLSFSLSRLSLFFLHQEKVAAFLRAGTDLKL